MLLYRLSMKIRRHLFATCILFSATIFLVSYISLQNSHYNISAAVKEKMKRSPWRFLVSKNNATTGYLGSSHLLQTTKRSYQEKSPSDNVQLHVRPRENIKSQNLSSSRDEQISSRIPKTNSVLSNHTKSGATLAYPKKHNIAKSTSQKDRKSKTLTKLKVDSDMNRTHLNNVYQVKGRLKTNSTASKVMASKYYGDDTHDNVISEKNVKPTEARGIPALHRTENVTKSHGHSASKNLKNKRHVDKQQRINFQMEKGNQTKKTDVNFMQNKNKGKFANTKNDKVINLQRRKFSLENVPPNLIPDNIQVNQQDQPPRILRNIPPQSSQEEQTKLPSKIIPPHLLEKRQKILPQHFEQWPNNHGQRPDNHGTSHTEVLNNFQPEQEHMVKGVRRIHSNITIYKGVELADNRHGNSTHHSKKHPTEQTEHVFPEHMEEQSVDKLTHEILSDKAENLDHVRDSRTRNNIAIVNKESQTLIRNDELDKRREPNRDAKLRATDDLASLNRIVQEKISNIENRFKQQWQIVNNHKRIDRNYANETLFWQRVEQSRNKLQVPTGLFIIPQAVRNDKQYRNNLRTDKKETNNLKVDVQNDRLKTDKQDTKNLRNDRQYGNILQLKSDRRDGNNQRDYVRTDRQNENNLREDVQNDRQYRNSLRTDKQDGNNRRTDKQDGNNRRTDKQDGNNRRNDRQYEKNVKTDRRDRDKDDIQNEKQDWNNLRNDRQDENDFRGDVRTDRKDPALVDFEQNRNGIHHRNSPGGEEYGGVRLKPLLPDQNSVINLRSNNSNVATPRENILRRVIFESDSREAEDMDSEDEDRRESCAQCFTLSFRTLISPVLPCGGNTDEQDAVYLLILISSTPGKYGARSGIRQTWGQVGRDPRLSVRCVFLLALTGDAETNEMVRNESHKYDDIVLFDFWDSYANLTYKTLMGLKWSREHCSQAKYIMKTDEDVYVNTQLIPRMLQAAPDSQFIGGYCWGLSTPHRDFTSKWYVSFRQYSRSHFPPMCSGTGYIVSSDVCDAILHVSPNIPFFYLEDVYIALCIQHNGIVPVNIAGFSNMKSEFDGCEYRNYVMTSHQIDEYEMIDYWELTQQCPPHDFSPLELYLPMPYPEVT